MRDKLAGYVQDALHKHQGQNAALHAQAQTPDTAKQHQILSTLLTDGKISDTAHAIAKQTLHAQNASIRNQQTDNDKQIIARVWDLKNTTPHPALTDLSAADYAYLKSRGLSGQAQAILNGHPAQDDPKLFNDLHRLSAEDPVKFAQANLLAHSGNLSRAHLTYLQGVQDAVNKQTPKEMEASRQVNDTAAMVQSRMRDAGMKLDHQPGTGSAETLHQFESGLRDKIIAAQQAKNGTPLSRDDVRTLAMGYLMDHALNGAGQFARPGGNEPSDYASIPAAERQQIADDLQKAGVHAHEANIQQAYRIAKGGR